MAGYGPAKVAGQTAMSHRSTEPYSPACTGFIETYWKSRVQSPQCPIRPPNLPTSPIISCEDFRVIPCIPAHHTSSQQVHGPTCPYGPIGPLNQPISPIRSRKVPVFPRFGLPVTACALPVIACALVVTTCALPVIVCALVVIGCALTIIPCALPVTACALTMITCALTQKPCALPVIACALAF
jgi:hypothetical protein